MPGPLPPTGGPPNPTPWRVAAALALACGALTLGPSLSGPPAAAWAASTEEEPNAQERARLQAVVAQSPRLAPREVMRRALLGESITILDVRSKDAFDRGHIAGARSVPRSQLAQHLAGLPRNHLLVTYCTCADDFNAALAAMALKEAGFPQVAALAGGMYAWQDAKLPTTQPAAPLDGEGLYLAHCATCHQPGGEGQAGVVPALKGSPWVGLDSAKPLLVLLVGGVRTGRYPTAMPAFQRLNDAELAALATHLRQSFGAKPGRVAPAAAAAARREALASEGEGAATRPASTTLP